jgi:AraC family transcriptional regulator
VCEYVESFLEGPISLADLAGIAGVSVSRFAHVFKEDTGCAPHQYILATRVNRAKSLLREPDLTIAEVAQRCGFGDQSHLTNAFRQRVGTSPHAYRRSLSPAIRASRAPSDSD